MPAYRTRDTRTIISPTPRAFTFPITHDAPYATPSSSPFEPELKLSSTPPPVRAFSPTSSIGSETSSLLSTPSSATSSQVSHRRRRSTVSDNERRPKKGDEDYIKRPENAFILFRRKCCEDRQQALEEGDDAPSAPVKKQRQADLSKTISQQWKGLPADERQYWEDLAKEKKKEHEHMYPNYVYRPQRVKKSKKGKGKHDGEQEANDGISFIMPVPSPPRSLSRGYSHGHGRRAASAPTPPPTYQTIQLPTVFMPSCPGSPTSVPRISRRTSYIPPPTDCDPSTHFEYLPQDAALPPSFHRPNFDPNFSFNSFPNFQFDSQNSFPSRASLQSLSIPPEQPSFLPHTVISPADSIASSIFSGSESAASSFSPASSHAGPFTPVSNLSITTLSIGQHSSQPEPECVPDDIDDISGGQLGFGGYSTWSPESLWPESSEMINTDDFDLTYIPPIELGMTMPEPACDSEGRQYRSMPEEPYSDMPGQDPFADLFAYENMSW
ncbi:hypothetical protein EW026_g2091 [Hermanssonia centrifuga]|uniref:HMG box domain-containing protein n=1 Tax=Hermanssonia centrifuga TaxID=98765 RepID=A0A4S4KPD8_9APHY|nr:hypothetical protein EW026_g2091 [Hermanssonia centrifuga]